ncbi:MAG: iron ABC transporter permease [Alphaproteobacteria bacterium]|nr:iron ABC transporter permease [Alphaproteobacteria bacterium]
MNASSIALDAAAGRRARGGLPALAALLLLALVVAVAVGASAIAPWRVAAVLLDLLGLADAGDRRIRAIVVDIRLPRAALGMLVGASLGAAGAAMQGLFRNPLADPGLIGVSSGAALAAVATIVLGGPIGAVTVLGLDALPLAAFAGGLATTALLLRFGQPHGPGGIATLLLAGIGINAIAGAATGVLIYMSDDRQLRDITFWTMGSLGGATWARVGAVAPFIVAAVAAMPLFARALDALALGDAEAGHLGVNTRRLARLIALAAACAVGASVAVSGMIGFLGIVAPHLARLLLGPGHRRLLPASALIGATVMLLADCAARLIVAPAELPIGLVCAAIGAPVFLALVRRARRRELAP